MSDHLEFLGAVFAGVKSKNSTFFHSHAILPDEEDAGKLNILGKAVERL